MFKKALGKVVDWSRVNQEDYLLTMERSSVWDTEIKQILRMALTDQIYDREIYMKGFDRSYLYEGYSAFKAEDL